MAGEEITIDTLRNLLGIQTQLRDRAETQWQKAQRALVSLLETFAPQEADRRLKNGEPLDSLPVEELEQLVRLHIRQRMNELQKPVRFSENLDLSILQIEIQKKDQEMDRLRIENQGLNARILNLESTQNQSFTAPATQAKQAPPDNLTTQLIPAGPSMAEMPLAPEPDWMSAWRKRETFTRDASILQMIAETGLSRRPKIEVEAASRLGIKRAGGSINSLIGRLEAEGLIDCFRPWEDQGGGSGGKYPDLIRLTENGRLAYWLLTGKQAGSDEFESLLGRHVTPEHTYLNLAVADFFKEEGYQINLFPNLIELPGGMKFYPDQILIDPDGSLIYLEVEREANKDREKRQAKWLNFYEASQGKLYVACDNRTCMRSIRSEINFSLGNRPGIVHLTNLTDLQSGKRGEGDSLWLEVRKRE
ncbi:MAG: hypothetical protein PHQ40_08645 [Anaerolineaceae bacterium]|nr:hypothetical protein [Anaerolineaceae bacterium]